VRTRFLLIAAVVTSLGAACTSGSGNPKHASSTPSVSTASPTPTRTGPLATGPGVRPGEKPPTLPQAAKQRTPAGALAFAAYYFKALDWSIATTDAYLLRNISSPSCPACRRAITGLTSLRAEHGNVSGGRIRISSAKVVTGTFKVRSDYVVEVFVDEDPVVLIRASAPPTTTAPRATNDPSLVFVSWADSGWKIIEVGAPSS
jgi:hypothetical protein